MSVAVVVIALNFVSFSVRELFPVCPHLVDSSSKFISGDYDARQCVKFHISKQSLLCSLLLLSCTDLCVFCIWLTTSNHKKTGGKKIVPPDVTKCMINLWFITREHVSEEKEGEIYRGHFTMNIWYIWVWNRVMVRDRNGDRTRSSASRVSRLLGKSEPTEKLNNMYKKKKKEILCSLSCACVGWKKKSKHCRLVWFYNGNVVHKWKEKWRAHVWFSQGDALYERK